MLKTARLICLCKMMPKSFQALLLIAASVVVYTEKSMHGQQTRCQTTQSLICGIVQYSPVSIFYHMVRVRQTKNIGLNIYVQIEVSDS